MVSENDVHVVVNEFDGTVDLSQLLRVRPLLHGSTLLTVTDGVTVFAFCTRSPMFSLISWVGTFHSISQVAPTITIFPHVEVVGAAYFVDHIDDVVEHGPQFPADGDLVDSAS